MKRIISAVVVLFSGYIVADAWDIVPGIFTTAPTIPSVAPAPQVTPLALETPQQPEFSALPADQNADILRTLKNLQNDSRASGRVNAVVVDPINEKTIAEINGDKLSRPASNMKYLTATAAVNALGPKTTFDTVVQRDGDNLYLVGGGDILLTETPNADNPYKPIDDQIVGHANLQDLATQAAKELETGHSYTLYVDSSRYLDPQYHPQVVAEGIARFVMPLRPIAIDRGRHGDPHNPVYIDDPDLVAGQAFVEQLREQGIDVTLADRQQAPDGASDIGRVHSATVRQIVGLMLRESDNNLAQLFAHEVAKAQGEPADFDGAAKAVTQVLTDAGYPMDGIIFDDGVGLSDKNRVSPKLIAAILQRAWSCDECAEKALAPELATGGLSGTLKERFLDPSTAGSVHAKTGTLATTSALSGYVVTAEGHPLIFSILITDYDPGQYWNIRATIDATVTKLITDF